jgi:NAD+ synthase
VNRVLEAGVPILRAEGRPRKSLKLELPVTTDFLVAFLRDEVGRRKGFERVVVPLSGGIDSAVTIYLAVRAFGAENVHALRLPYRTSNPDSLLHAQLVIDDLGVPSETVEITGMVDGYAALVPSMTPHRLGNVMARARMVVAFDKAAELGAVHLGTGNKTERLFGYYTWHDVADAAPVNPLGDLFKTQVRALAEYLGVPHEVSHKPPSADLVVGQSDEDDLGISYERADTILIHHLAGFEDPYIQGLGFSEAEITLVKGLVARTHWKRALPVSATVSSTAIGEFYLRPVDY